LEGLSVDGAPSFENWLAGQRHRFGQLRQQLLERLSTVLQPHDRVEVLRELIEIAPFDETGHIALVNTLVDCALYSEARQQIEASVRHFQNEGIDPSSLKSAFAKAQHRGLKPARGTRVSTPCLGVTCNQQEMRARRPTLLVMPFAAPAPEEAAD